MRHIIQPLARLVILFSVLVPRMAFAAAVKPTGAFVPGEIVVKIRAGASASDVASVHQAADADKGERISEVNAGTIFRMHSRSKNTDALIRALERNPNVVYVEPNYILRLEATPNDSSYAQLWGLRNVGQPVGGVIGTAGSDIGAEAAWNVTTGSPAIVVGVVDTGVDYTHPDLAANIWSNPGGMGNVNCAAGTHGFNAITKSCDPKDDHYHGTHVAGTIGAVGNNGVGVAGVNWTTSIMGLKFLSSSGYGTTADAIAAIDFAVQAKIDGVNVRVLNNSWGGGAFSKALFDEILKANEHDILFVASAGNNSSNTDSVPNYPSGYGAPNMISVAATDNRDRLAYFSNYGPNSVHLGAPGEDVFSTYSWNGYSTLSGTSMASPHVTGVAALVLAHTPTLTTAEVKSAILGGVDPIASLAGRTVTGGRLNAAKALGVTQGPDFTISTSTPSAFILRGDSTSVEITIAPSGGFNGSVDLAVSGLPYGATASLSANPASTGSTLTLTTSANTPISSSTITINAISGALAHSVSFTLNTVASPPVAVCPVFSSYYTPYVFTGPSAAALGDFNRDGHVDMAVVSPGSNAMSILLGRTGGGFVYGSSLPGGSGPISVVAADFNHDGKPDLATAMSGSSSVSIRLGLGDGRFSDAVSFSSGANPFWLASGDFDEDGRADLAVANNGSGDISILLGNGDGTFAAAVNYSVGSGPFWITIGEFNRDGNADLAVAVFNANKVAILLGNGDGSFQSPVGYPTGSGTSSVAIGDLNGDGSADLAVTGFASDDVSVRMGNGDGTFQAPVSYASGDGPYSIALADIDEDGDFDLAVANGNSSNLSILRGEGDGTFGATVNHTQSAGPSHVISADIDRDGLSDLVVVTTGSSWVRIMRNTGACSKNCGAMTPTAGHSVGTNPKSVVTGDFNGDGKVDVATANRGANTVSIAMGIGDGSFEPSVDRGTGSAPESLSTADIDGNGSLDLAVANRDSNDVSILAGNGDGSFQAAVNHSVGTNPHAISIADLNRDGKLDLVVANSGSDDVSILLANGAGSFATAVVYPAGSNPESIASADFNGDGRADLVVANRGSDDASVLLGNGDGTFQAGTTFATGDAPVAIAVADFNRDGKSDLAVANSGSADVSVLRGTGSGAFGAADTFDAGAAPSSLTAGDFNDDGVVDLAVANRSSNHVSLLFGQGDASFSTAIDHPSGTNPEAIATADVDGDGKLDLAVANGATNDLTLLLNSCPAPDLIVSKTHTGSFTQGDRGRLYTITVTNVGGAEASGLVGVTDSLPIGMSAVALSGIGWNCSLGTVTCTRSDALPSGTSYPPITLTVNIANNSPVSLTNSVTVAGGGELNTLNDSASDTVTVAQVPDLVIEKTHTGAFAQGETGENYIITIRNPGGLPTTGAVTVTESIPAGLTATGMNGQGWTCDLGSLACSRSDSLASGASYPVIRVSVNVAADAPAEVINTATVAGGGDVVATNNTAYDRTIVWSSQTCSSFGPGVDYVVGGEPRALAIEDFNGDGVADLVTGGSWNDGISVLLGTGLGAFAPAVKSLTGGTVRNIEVAGFNHDGLPDLAVINYSSPTTVSILRGVGDGTFSLAASYAVPDSPYQLATGDFNGDGSADIAVTSRYAEKVSILIGNGDGSFQDPVAFGAGDDPTAIIDGDFDGDQKVDIAVTNYYDGTVSVLRGNGDGTFEPPVPYPAGYGATSLSIGDLNEDGRADFVVSGAYSSSVAVLLGNGDATFGTAVSYYAGYSYAGQAVIEDVNGDGKQDIATASYSEIVTLAGNGDGSFQQPKSRYLGYSPYRFAVSDLNGDGKADLAATHSSVVSVMLGACPDLEIKKSHTGDFRGGQSNATYSLEVKNSGAAPTLGAVTVTDTLPAGLTAVSMTGYGWTCTLAGVTCTRSDALATGGSFPAIALTVSVSNTAPASVTNVANVSGGSELNTTNNSASDPTTIVQGTDLRITKSHTQAFVAGVTGSTYTITVSNAGSQPTAGIVTVVDALPAGLTATSLQGTGWNCSLGSISCNRSDALDASAAYPSIVLMVEVAENCASLVTNVVTVSGGGDVDATNNTASDPTVVLRATSSIGAFAASNTTANVFWDPVYGATSYLVYRATGAGGFSVIGTSNFTGFTDNSLVPNTVYRYRVQARSGSVLGPMSVGDSTMTKFFTDDPIVPGTTTVKALHFTELRAGVEMMRAAAGLAPATFTDPALNGATIKAIHVTELWNKLNEARAALGLALASYTDFPATPGHPIQASNVQQFRQALK